MTQVVVSFGADELVMVRNLVRRQKATLGGIISPAQICYNESITNTLQNMGKMSPVVHFEMPAEDKKRMVDFYTKVFGWQTQQMGPEMGEYTVVTTTETDPKTRRPVTPGAINGGFYGKDKTNINDAPHIVIAVDDIQETMKQVKEAGGKVIGGQKPGEPDDIPGVGLYVSCKDTEGNTVGVLQPSPSM